MYRFLFVFLLVFAPVGAQAQGFLLGMAAGSLLGGGDSSHQSNGATVLYLAKEDVLKTVDPLQVKMVASEPNCFNDTYSGTNKNLGEIFNDLVKKRGNHQRTVLQIVRVFSGSNTSCASIWYTYLEK